MSAKSAPCQLFQYCHSTSILLLVPHPRHILKELTMRRRTIANDHLDEAAERTKERIQWLLDLEGNLATLNTHYYANYKDKFLAYYKASRDENNLVVRFQRDRRAYEGELDQLWLQRNRDIGSTH
ncbi:hypothetical protein J3R83DRAFT_970 [Lanmaoa asiatica]|nr:hypothetical protein J3R83DRAFT_970 [Lanmaoa asiatica]